MRILISSTERSGDFPPAAKGAAATIWHDAADYTVVTIAATEPAEDVERVVRGDAEFGNFQAIRSPGFNLKDPKAQRLFAARKPWTRR